VHEVRDRVKVVYNPAVHRHWRYVSSLLERRNTYIFYAGGANPHKSPRVLLRAFRLLREWGEIDVELVMTGIAGTWAEALARRYGVGQVVRSIEKPPEGEYSRLIAGTEGTVLPSVRLVPLLTMAVEFPEIVDRYGVVSSPLLEKMAVSKVLVAQYDREVMWKNAFDEFGNGNMEVILSLLASLVK
jgi:glycosyltransferase involved in cell wall biosynthesis